MELKWIEDFISLARTGNFSKSAAERNVSQPAFSRRIRALELWLGAQLIDRSTYPTSLTEAGEAFRRTADDLVRLLDDSRASLRGLQSNSANLIAFSATHTVSLSFFPQWLRSVENRIGPVETRLNAENFHDGVRMLIEGHVDFFISMIDPAFTLTSETSQFPSIKLGDERLVPVSAPDPAGRPLFALPGSKRSPVPFLDYAPESYMGRAVSLLLETSRTRTHLRRCYENSMAESLKMMTIQMHGLAWLPELSIRRELCDGTLVPAGGSEWEIPMELRIFRGLEPCRPAAERLWTLLSGEA